MPFSRNFTRPGELPWPWRFQWKQMDGQTHEGFESELLIIELKTASGIWEVYGLYKCAAEAEWLGDPVPSHVDVGPVSAFGYWREQDHNGISHAVFGYWVRSRAAAELLLARGREKLADGATPFTEIQINSILDLADSAPSTEIPQTVADAVVDDTEEPEVEPVDEHWYCEARALPHATALALVWRLAAELGPLSGPRRDAWGGPGPGAPLARRRLWLLVSEAIDATDRGRVPHTAHGPPSIA